MSKSNIIYDDYDTRRLGSLGVPVFTRDMIPPGRDPRIYVIPGEHPVKELTSEQIDTLTHYADGLGMVCHETDMSIEQIREAALDHNVEQCPNCRWWAESSEMLPMGSDEPDGFCENCRPAERQ